MIADSGFIYALFNPQDTHHARAMAFATQYSGGTVIPQIVLPEVSYVAERDLGYNGMTRLVGQIIQISAPLEPIIKADLERAYEIMTTYANAEMDLVDCCIMAMLERLKIEEVATFDRRDFSIFRPKHCDYLTLLP